jgi:hypothetical protein
MFVFGAVNAIALLTTFAGILAAGGAAALVKSGICFVQEHELGNKKFLGKALRYRFNRGRYRFGAKKGQRKRYRFGSKKGEFKPERKKGQIKVRKPGRCFTFPGILRLAKTSVVVSDLKLDIHTFTLADQTVYSCAAAAFYKVRRKPRHLEKALYGTSDLHAVLHAAALIARSRILKQAHHSDLSGVQSKELQTRLTHEFQMMVSRFGVRVFDFELTTSEPDVLTNLRNQSSELVSVNAAALKQAVAYLGLDDSREVWAAIGAAVIPGSSALVATNVPSSHQELPSGDDNHDGNGHGNGHGAAKIPDLSRFMK